MAEPSAGSEMARPAARHSISMRQPWPTCFSPPITQSTGTNTWRPWIGPFMKALSIGRWRRPISMPSCGTGISAQVMPSSRSPSGLLSSTAWKASPTTVATGASVM